MLFYPHQLSSNAPEGPRMAPSSTITPANLLLIRQNNNAPSGGSPTTQLNTTTIIGLSVAGGALLILVICLTTVWIKKKRSKQNATARGRSEGRKRPIGNPIPIEPSPIDLQRPQYQQSTESFNSTLADIKFDPYVATFDIHSTCGRC